MKPITCLACGIASYPGCLDRTGHPHSDGQFSDCGRATPDVDNDGAREALMLSVRAIIHEEFAIFRDAIKTDMKKIIDDIQIITKRLDEMKGKVASLSGGPEEELIEEIQERERRAANVILLNAEEKRSQDNAQEIKDHDMPQIGTYRTS